MSEVEILRAAAGILRRMAGDTPGQNDYYMRMASAATCILAVCDLDLATLTAS